MATKPNGTVVEVNCAGTNSEHVDAASLEPPVCSDSTHRSLRAWAGPKHWRPIAFSKSKTSLMPQAAPRKSTKLSLLSLQQWDANKNTLPDDLFIDPKKLHCLSHIQCLVGYSSPVFRVEFISHVEKNSDREVLSRSKSKKPPRFPKIPTEDYDNCDLHNANVAS